MAKYKLTVYTNTGVAPTLTAISNSGEDVAGFTTKLGTTAYDSSVDATEYLIDHPSLNIPLMSPDVTVTTADGSNYDAGASGDFGGTSGLNTVSGAPMTVYNIIQWAEPSNKPVIVSVDNVTYAENRTDKVLTVVATDADGDTPTYDINRGPDADKFTIDPSTGELRFVDQPDFENPADSDGDNVYELRVEAAANGDYVTQEVTITVTDASEADAHTTIDTAAVAQMLGGELTVDGIAAVVSGLATAADAADTANRQELINLITPLQTAVQEAQAAADRLESYELGQIEDLLTQLVETAGFQQLLETATVTVNGNTRSVASILQAIAEAPKVANWKRTTDTSGKMNGVIATLTDGTAVQFDMTVEAIDENTNKHVFSVADFANTGLAKSFYMVMRAKALSFGGLFGGRLTNAQLGWALDEISNILFDVTGNEASAIGNVSVPDYNTDGAVGNA